MRILPPQLIDTIQAWDATIDILWNNRINRWIVVQKLPKWMPVTESLRGISTINGEYSNYKVLFVCEFSPHGEHIAPGSGLPVEPGPWIVRRLWEVAPIAGEERLIEERERLIEEEKERDFQRDLEAITSSVKSDLKAYAGFSDYGGFDPVLAKKHIIIASK